MERWAIYGKIGRKWKPLFKDGRSYKTKAYANKIMRDMAEWGRITNRRLDLKVKAVIATHCPLCNTKIIE